MGHDWVIHVLSDLRQFAQQNEMPLLSEQLDEAMMTAAIEMADSSGPTNRTPQGDVILPNIGNK
ncbi:hypothetical protein [Yoonia litorea]|uniref:Uncharacterized protein n=1 Tax=Yoonia litorea TaxID=1123755 RepID=A0A1I6L6R3_9RHOB|nr:hypothetical protein [Yoonia litorea]SFR99165.1 hypothetical protein SAMN05444714_0247 [Yoonia litorea]